MNINFLPKLYRDLGSDVAGSTPYGAIAQGAIGLVQTGLGAISAAKNQRKLETLANNYQPNQSILHYYNQALAKYNPNAYNSQEYQNRANVNARNLTTGINAFTDRRAGIGNVSSLVQGANDANANAASQAEAAQRANLGQLGQATGMKAGEDTKKFDMRYNLLAMKAGGANATEAAGIKNLYGGLQNASDLQMANKMYGNNYGGGNNNKIKSGWA